MSNILRLVGIIIVVGLIGYAVVWAVNNRSKLFTTSTSQTTSDNTQSSPQDNTQTSSQDNLTADANLPKLTDVSPQDNFTTSSDKVAISGKTDPGNKVSINNQDIPVDAQGNFSQSIILSTGTNRINITSKDSSGKENTMGLIYTLDPAASPQTVSTPVVTTNPQTSTAATTNTNSVVVATTTRTGGADFILPLVFVIISAIAAINYPKKARY